MLEMLARLAKSGAKLSAAASATTNSSTLVADGRLSRPVHPARVRVVVMVCS